MSPREHNCQYSLGGKDNLSLSTVSQNDISPLKVLSCPVLVKLASGWGIANDYIEKKGGKIYIYIYPKQMIYHFNRHIKFQHASVVTSTASLLGKILVIFYT